MEFDSTRNDALNFLQSNPLGALATINASNIPDVSAIYFFVEKDFSCYFVTKVETRKFKNSVDKKVATLLSFDEEALVSAEVTGLVEVIAEQSEVSRIIEAFQALASARKAHYWVPPISLLTAGQYVVCKLVASRVTFSNFSSNADKPESAAHQVSFNPHE